MLIGGYSPFSTKSRGIIQAFPDKLFLTIKVTDLLLRQANISKAVMPESIRYPVLFWIPAFAGMTA
jgi:hypothetical protein